MCFGQLMYNPIKVETGIDILEEGKIYADGTEKLGFIKYYEKEKIFRLLKFRRSAISESECKTQTIGLIYFFINIKNCNYYNLLKTYQNICKHLFKIVESVCVHL